MSELIILTALVVFISMSYIIKFILKEHAYETRLFNDHHKDPSAFLL